MVVDGCSLTYLSDFHNSEYEVMVNDKEFTWAPRFAPGFNNMHDIFSIIASYKEDYKNANY